jgi:hypothetical protein
MVSARLDMHRPSVCLISGHEKRLPSRLAGCIAREGVHKGMRMTQARKTVSKAVSKKAGAVVPLIPPKSEAIQPPESWQLKTSFGYMRANAEEGGELVRLGDLLRWIENTRQVPRKKAIEMVLEALPPDVMDWLFQLKPDDYAEPVPKDCMFGQLTAREAEAKEDEAQRKRNEREFQKSQGSFVMTGRVRQW